MKINIPLDIAIEQGDTSGDPGFVYLLHFEQPYKGARHYLGYTTDVDKRMQRHEQGYGNKLVQTVLQAGIPVTLVRLWHGCRNYERKLKLQKNTARVCPCCQEKKS